MFSNDVQHIFDKVGEISRLSYPFCQAEREGNIDEARRISRIAGDAINSVVLDLRRLQDAGRSPKDTNSVGRWIKKATDEQCAQAIAMRGISTGDHLPLRESLNKFAHVKQASYSIDPEHRMILVGELGGQKWIVDISIADFCTATCDALHRTS